ncbi:MAG TPA: biopolymer transporter ExbD [Kofleriaceae bacterium]|jgi:biopolymer transport protein ExbD|nr:biopolymer transporter ExbD [Kofleriaceae bacterium]
MKAVGKHHRYRLPHKPPPKLDSVRNEINVTPLVDVCLVLLIIFMVILPMLARGKEVPVPQTFNHSAEKDAQQPIVAIDEDGKLYVDKEQMPNIEAMKERIKDEWKALEARNNYAGADRRGEGRVLVKADANIVYDKVFPIIMAVHEAGAVGIDLGTNEAKDTSGAKE